MLFHVTTRTEWDPSAASHTPGGFEAEGFVHLATREQVEGVLERYFDGLPDLLLLSLDEEELPSGAVKWEPGAGSEPGPFPHLYAPIPRDAIVAVEPL
ncbi:MAG TPA: DUF952 domain-containing protein [Solirubrobacteraceae bacterium]|nr:DUF952 domain-containing protein [Solirubrobacteraceae bacterium]